MTEFSKLKDLPKRPFRTLVGSSILLLYGLGPFLMLIVYYYAYKGSLACIILSALQIIAQIFAKRSQTYLNLLRYLDLELYFDAFTFETVDGPINQDKSLFAVHPHGIFSLGMFLNNHRDHFGKNAVVCGSRMVTIAPIMGLLHKLGGMVSVNPESLQQIMKKGNNIALLPGGFEEATISSRKENRIFIKSRKGFIKYAIRYGYKVYPTFVFNENRIYNYFDKYENFRLFLNKFKLVGVIFWSKLGMLPEFNHEIHTVVGKPMDLPHIENPSQDIVEKYHTQYIEQIQALYEKYSKIYNVKEELKLY
ncbi:hypothetical protein ABPG74_021983 [Tetrahymena malaccensis]